MKRVPRRLRRECREIATEVHDLDGYAAEKAERELLSDDTLRALWKASRAADNEQSARQNFDLPPGESEPAVSELREASRAADDAFDALSGQIVKEALKADVQGHSVRLDHKRDLDPCLSCGESTEGYYLGTAAGNGDTIAGWVCGYCGAEIQERTVSGDLSVVSEGSE